MNINNVSNLYGFYKMALSDANLPVVSGNSKISLYEKCFLVATLSLFKSEGYIFDKGRLIELSFMRLFATNQHKDTPEEYVYVENSISAHSAFDFVKNNSYLCNLWTEYVSKSSAEARFVKDVEIQITSGKIEEGLVEIYNLAKLITKLDVEYWNKFSTNQYLDHVESYSDETVSRTLLCLAICVNENLCRNQADLLVMEFLQHFADYECYGKGLSVKTLSAFDKYPVLQSYYLDSTKYNSFEHEFLKYVEVIQKDFQTILYSEQIKNTEFKEKLCKEKYETKHNPTENAASDFE